MIILVVLTTHRNLKIFRILNDITLDLQRTANYIQPSLHSPLANTKYPIHFNLPFELLQVLPSTFHNPFLLLPRQMGFSSETNSLCSTQKRLHFLHKNLLLLQPAKILSLHYCFPFWNYAWTTHPGGPTLSKVQFL